ncbi:Bystin-domain-containing protein [Russula aff. rugulosa BPL654]|nr:Bystin-domain-containing protein [Russula aff. rugulosa BPL654]KAI0274362.1 Bystin-domain-containing protein [Russula aff. rugulosa BPL654]
MVSLCIIFSPSWMPQSRPAPTQLPCRPTSKTFKITPSLPAWACILALTSPEQWSPQATRAATRIFISNMKPPQARVYLEGVVLGLALKRSLYKPAAFFKAIIFPLLDVSGLDGSISMDIGG